MAIMSKNKEFPPLSTDVRFFFHIYIRILMISANSLLKRASYLTIFSKKPVFSEETAKNCAGVRFEHFSGTRGALPQKLTYTKWVVLGISPINIDTYRYKNKISRKEKRLNFLNSSLFHISKYRRWENLRNLTSPGMFFIYFKVSD